MTTQNNNIPAPRILIADDDAISRLLALRLLQKLGCLAEAADDGDQALRLHAAVPYDLLLMDCDMPHLNGYDACRRLRQQEGGARRTPVVALTAARGDGQRLACMEAGMDDFLAKPVALQALESMLSRWLARPAFVQDELDKTRARYGAHFAELSTLYRAESPPRIAAMRQACASGDAAAAGRLAHLLAGSSAAMGASGMAVLCRELELRMEQGMSGDWTRALADIEAEYARLARRLGDPV